MLEQLFEKFELPNEIYDIEEEFINRVITTFNSHNRNFGVLLKGLKGTGKTITAKILCNRLNLPVFLVTTPFAEMGNFINSIGQNIIMLFDEFEKMYSMGSWRATEDEQRSETNLSNLLTLMDGVFTSPHKRLFILTTNSEYVPDAMRARPSRIRYTKDLSETSLETVHRILESTVRNKTLIPHLIELLKGMEVISIDIIQSMAEEANLYDRADKEFFDCFNIKFVEHLYDILEIMGKQETLVMSGISLQTRDLRIGATIYNEFHEGVYVIESIDRDKHTIVARRYNERTGGESRKQILLKYRRTLVPHATFLAA